MLPHTAQRQLTAALPFLSAGATYDLSPRNGSSPGKAEAFQLEEEEWLAQHCQHK